MDSDFEGLERWRAGDAEAGEALFERHFPAIARFFRNKADQAWEDLVQRTFLACVEGRDRFGNRSTFRSYLFGIANNVLREHYRAMRKQASIDDAEDCSLHDLAPRASTLLAQRTEEELLLQGLRRLPFDDQLMLELRFWEQLRLREIAEVTELPEGTVSSRLRRARQKLEKAIAQLSDDEAVLRRTCTGLETWAEGLRQRFGRP